MKTEEQLEFIADYFTACHEAGHAVVSYALGRRFRHITINPDKDSDGHLTIDRRCFNGAFLHIEANKVFLNYREKIETSLMIICGGPIAENKILGEIGEIFEDKHIKDQRNCDPEFRLALFVLDAFLEGTASSKKRALDSRELAYDSANQEAQAYFDWIYIYTRKLLKIPKWWRSVEAIASNLMDTKTITYKEASRIIDSEISTHASGAYPLAFASLTGCQTVKK